MSAFRENPFPSKESRRILANKTGLEEAVISKGLINQRTKLRNQCTHISWQGIHADT